MSIVTRKCACWLTPVVLASSTGLYAQQKPADYPVRPIRIIIGVAPGAGSDYIARLTGQVMTERWGQNVVVDPRPGGGGVIASGLAAKAAPDGYTLYQNGFTVLLQGATKRVDFDVLKTFVPIVRTSSQPYILLGHPSLKATTVKELIAQSAAKPLTYAGSSGIGSTVHIGMERLANLSGMKVKYVAYKGSSPALLALMGGEINMAASSAMSAISAIKTGKVRGLASMGAKRMPLLPDLPTIAEQGFPGYTLTNAYNLWAPIKTPAAIVDAINKVVTEGLNAPEVEKRIMAAGGEGIDPISSKELSKIVARDYADLVQSVKQLGLTF
ncbi:MAG TPA: tripartite tricarboxylate transporter substrate binding protein [Burkholderiales bacterium]|nr:tripartite tricarboxylate transporter substrate binding protein [Burkholderiales bacterium]